MEEFFRAIGEFILELIESVLENYISTKNWDLTWLMYLIFAPVVIMYAVVFGIVAVQKIKEKLKKK